MELYIDTANAEKIEQYCKEYPIAGFTCNPTIVTRDGQTVEELVKLVPGKRVFVQVIAEDYEGILADARKLKAMRDDIYVKIPCTADGYKAIYTLHQEGFKILATAIYTVGQALMAAACGADYIAPYVNRMSDSEVDGCGLVEDIVRAYRAQNIDTKIVAASFKNLNQVVRLLVAGAEAVTIPLDVFEKLINNKSTYDATRAFTENWEAHFNRRSI